MYRKKYQYKMYGDVFLRSCLGDVDRKPQEYVRRRAFSTKCRQTVSTLHHEICRGRKMMSRADYTWLIYPDSKWLKTQQQREVQMCFKRISGHVLDLLVRSHPHDALVSS